MPGGSLIPQQQDRHFFGILNALCLEMDITIIHYKKNKHWWSKVGKEKQWQHFYTIINELQNVCFRTKI